MIAQYLKKNSSTIQLIFFLVYPIIPLVFLASATLFAIIFESNHLTYDFQKIKPILLSALFFLGGPAGLIGWYFILQNKYSITTISLFIYGCISYSIIAGYFILIGVVALFKGYGIFGGLHSLYLLFTFWVIGKQLIMIYMNYKNYTKQKTLTNEVLNS